MWMFIFLWVSVGFLFLWVVFQQVCLLALNERLETLKHLHLNLDADTERRLNLVWEHLKNIKSQANACLAIWDSIHALERRVADAKNSQDLMNSCSKMASDKITSLGATVDVLCDRMAEVERSVEALEAGKISLEPAMDFNPHDKGLTRRGEIRETTPEKRFYEIDWNKTGIEFKPFPGESKAVTDGFNSKLVTRMDELNPKVSSSGDDLPGSPAATIGSQANNSSALLETMRPKPSELLKLFNSPPIICAEGAVLVKRKGV